MPRGLALVVMIFLLLFESSITQHLVRVTACYALNEFSVLLITILQPLSAATEARSVRRRK